MTASTLTSAVCGAIVRQPITFKGCLQEVARWGVREARLALVEQDARAREAERVISILVALAGRA